MTDMRFSLRRLALLAGLGLALTGCGNDPDQANPLDPLRQGLASLRQAQQSPTAAQIRANLTPQVRAQFGGAPLKIATLENIPLASVLIGIGDNRGTRTFTTPDGVSLSFAGGVLVATRGLGFDLMSADVSDIQAALSAGGGRELIRIHRYLDGENQIVIRSFVCDVTAAGGGRLTERCYGKDDQFDNSYHRGPGGQITASRQWIGPKYGYAVLEDAG